jgi:hypothetical protein
VTERSDLMADGLFGDLVDEIANHGKRDVGFEQRDAHFAHRRAHVGLAKRAAPAKAIEDAAQPFAQSFEHRNAGGRNLVSQRGPMSRTIRNDLAAPLTQSAVARKPKRFRRA